VFASTSEAFEAFTIAHHRLNLDVAMAASDISPFSTGWSLVIVLVRVLGIGDSLMIGVQGLI
jgi:hypothetical protein